MLRLLGNARCGTADVEGAHRELRARLADRLGGDDADRLADLDELAAREVASVAAAADAAPGLAREHRTDLHLLDARFLNGVRELLGDLVVLRPQLLARERVVNVFLRHTACGAVAQRLEDVAAFHDGGDDDAVERLAILFGDDDVLRHVDETAGEVSGVGGLERRVGQTLTRAVGGDEVLQHGEAFAEVRGDRRLDDLARRLGHQSAHAGELAHLFARSAGAGVGHHEDRVELAAIVLDLAHRGEHLVGHLLGGAVPDVDDLVVALAGRDRAVETVSIDLEHRTARPFDDLLLLRRDDHVVDADGDAGLRRVEEAEVLETVEHPHGEVVAVVDEAVVDELLEALLLEKTVEVRDLLRKVLVEDDASDRGGEELAVVLLHLGVHDVLVVELLGEIDDGAADAQTDRREQLDFAGLQRDRDFILAAERFSFALRALLFFRQVVAAKDEVLRRNRERLAVRRREDVVRREHQHLRLDLSLRRERDVNGHLVAVEVGVEGGADERVNLDRFAFDEHRLERLDAQAVQRRCAVEKHGMLFDDLIERVPHFVRLQLDELLRGLDRADEALLFELVVDERLEELERHLLRQTALIQFQFGSDNDDGAAGVVDALAEQVLTEASLLAFERVGERLQRTIVRALQHTAAAAVVEECIDRFLEHALFIAHDDVRRAQLEELLETVVAVDDAAIEIVEIRRREAAAVERHERTELGRNDRDDVEDHPLRTMSRLAERVDDFQPLRCFELFDLRRFSAHDEAQLIAELFHVDAAEKLFDRFRAHLRDKHVAVLRPQLAILLFRQQLFFVDDAGEIAGVDDHVRLEVENALEVAQGDVEQVSDARRQSFEEPHVRHRRGQLDVSHALAAHFRFRDFDAALIADDSAMLHALVLAAEAFPIGDRAEDLRAEEAVALRLEGAVVDRLRLGHFAVRPRPDLLRRREADLDGVEIVDRLRLCGLKECVE